MTSVTIDDELYTRFQAIALPGEDWNQFVEEATKEWLERHESDIAAMKADAESQAMLYRMEAALRVRGDSLKEAA